MRIFLTLCAVVVLLVSWPPAHAARPDPSVALEVQTPTDKSTCNPGERLDVQVQLTDPLQLVRHVFVRIATPDHRILNGDQDAQPPAGGRPTPGQPEIWRKSIELPASAPSGRYIVKVEALGDGNTPLQWQTVAFEVLPASFGMRVVSPPEGVVVSRNDTVDVTIQLEDPRRKARRVFVSLEDPRTKQVLNGDREAARKGTLWIRDVRIPATAAPGTYRLVTTAYGEGREILASQVRPVLVSMAPVHLADIVLDPPGGARPGHTVTIRVPLSDPRAIVRNVWVSVVGPNGRTVVNQASARKDGDAQVFELNLDEDAALGTYSIEITAVAQAGEVVATRRLTFPVRSR